MHGSNTGPMPSGFPPTRRGMVAGPEEGVSGRGGRGGQSRGRGSRGRAPTRHNAGNTKHFSIFCANCNLAVFVQ